MALQGIMKEKDSRSNLLEWEGKNSKKRRKGKKTSETAIKKSPSKNLHKNCNPRINCLEIKFDKFLIPLIWNFIYILIVILKLKEGITKLLYSGHKLNHQGT